MPRSRHSSRYSSSSRRSNCQDLAVSMQQLQASQVAQSNQVDNLAMRLQEQFARQFQDMQSQLQMQLAADRSQYQSPMARGRYLQDVLSAPTPGPPVPTTSTANSSASLATEASWEMPVEGQMPPANQQFQIGSDTPPLFQAQPLPLEDASDGEGLSGPSPLDA